MYLVLSHAAAFGALFVASLFDLDYGEVPDSVLVSGVFASVVFAAAQSLSATDGMSVLSLLASPGSVSMSAVIGDPLVISVVAGLLCFVYGWSAYLAGVWGGADALALAVIGFGATVPLGGSMVVHVVGLCASLLLAVVVYTSLFALWKAVGTPGVYRDVLRSLRERRWWCVAGAGLGAGALPLVSGWRGVVLGILMATWVPLYSLLQSVQEKALSREVPVGDLEGGEVVEAPGTDSRIRGISKQEIGELESDTVHVKSGVRLLPAFPVAVAITDLTSIGIYAAGLVFYLR
nr:MAG: hypothetical protein J07AB56_03670 [Candidatus Nanosalinarum sp. J07AB56]